MPNRILILAAAAFVAIVACTPAAPDMAADEAALRTAAPLWWDRYNAGDADSLTALYAEDAIVMVPGLPSLVGRAAIREYLANDIAASGSGGITMRGGDITGVGVAAHHGWVSGTFSALDAEGATVDNGKYVSVYRRQDGEWLIIRDIWNSDAVPVTTAAPVADTAAPARN